MLKRYLAYLHRVLNQFYLRILYIFINLHLAIGARCRSTFLSKFQDLQQSLEKEEFRLRAVRSSVDPAQIRELEESREKLKFWEKQLQNIFWNLENEDYIIIRSVDQPHQEVLKLVNLEDKSISRREGFPTSRRELLDKLQVKLVVMADRIEVKALFPIDPITCQLCTSGED